MVAQQVSRETVLAKTAKGSEEIDSRRHHLPSALRTVLIMVDGKTSLGDMMEACAIMPDFFESLMTLCDQGFILPKDQLSAISAPGNNAGVAPTTPAAVSLDAETKQKLVQLASVLLGMHADNVIKKIENSANDREAIAAAVNSCFKLIKLAIDENKADEFLNSAKAILSHRK
jgi:tRNA threonylcarbamoyladenosine modification (KEOPS) complex  Pcc1 subunit